VRIPAPVPDKLYIVTRRDLPPGFQATQAAHAAFAFAAAHPVVFQPWIADSNYLVVLSVADESALRVLLEQAVQRHLRFTAFHEPDRNDELTALALEPGPATSRLCANLPLCLREAVPV
jgi:peptidyl-tRNA hydrolase